MHDITKPTVVRIPGLSKSGLHGQAILTHTRQNTFWRPDQITPRQNPPQK